MRKLRFKIENLISILCSVRFVFQSTIRKANFVFNEIIFEDYSIFNAFNWNIYDRKNDYFIQWIKFQCKKNWMYHFAQVLKTVLQFLGRWTWVPSNKRHRCRQSLNICSYIEYSTCVPCHEKLCRCPGCI